MFEEGERMRQEFGADKVYDFTLATRTWSHHRLPPRAELRLAQEPVPAYRYMNNAGYAETRAAVAACQGIPACR